MFWGNGAETHAMIYMRQLASELPGDLLGWGGGVKRSIFMKIKLSHNFGEIISVENLLEAWREFLRGKRSKPDVQGFSLCLIDNIFSLHDDLRYFTYKHGAYQAFKINDPKPRDIHKASVRDRLLD